jgi:hypothetical protein
MSICEVASPQGSVTAFPVMMDNVIESPSHISNQDGILFSMDEDGGVKTPSAGSPESLDLFLVPPALRVRSCGTMVTPFIPIGGSLDGHGSVEDESDSPKYENENAGTDVTKEFRGASTFVAGFTHPSKRKDASSRLTCDTRSSTTTFGLYERDREDSTCSQGLQYPPLIEHRGCVESNQILKSMSRREWERFMKLAILHIRDSIKSGVWRDQKQVVQMSCPRF